MAICRNPFIQVINSNADSVIYSFYMCVMCRNPFIQVINSNRYYARRTQETESTRPVVIPLCWQ